MGIAQLFSHVNTELTRLNAIPKHANAATPFAPVVIQIPEVRGGNWLLMQAGPRRHSRYAHAYRNLDELMASWRIVVTGTDRDATGSFYTCEVMR